MDQQEALTTECQLLQEEFKKGSESRRESYADPRRIGPRLRKFIVRCRRFGAYPAHRCVAHRAGGSRSHPRKARERNYSIHLAYSGNAFARRGMPESCPGYTGPFRGACLRIGRRSSLSPCIVGSLLLATVLITNHASAQRATGAALAASTPAEKALVEKSLARGFRYEALDAAKLALETRDRALRPDQLDIAAWLKILSRLYAAIGDSTGARRALEREVAVRERVVGTDDLALALARADLANLCGAAGEYRLAESLFLRAISSLRRAVDARDAVIAPMQDLVSVYEHMGADDRAETALLDLLAVQRERLGESNADVALTLDNLAGLKERRKQFAEAKPFLDEALAIRERALRADPGNTGLGSEVARSLSRLVGAEQVLGSFARLRPRCERLVQLIEATLGPYSPALAEPLKWLVPLYDADGLHDQAEKAGLRAIALVASASNGLEVAAVRNELGVHYLVTGRDLSAETEFKEAIATYRKMGAPGLLADVLQTLGVAYDLRGDYGRAEPLLVEAMELRRSATPSDPFKLARSLSNLGEVFAHAGALARAEPLLEESARLREEILPHDDPLIALAKNNLAALRQSQNVDAPARYIPLYQEALDIRLRQKHPDPGAIAESLNNLCACYWHQGDYAKAETLVRRALSFAGQEPGRKGPLLAHISTNLARVLLARGDYQQGVVAAERGEALRERDRGHLMTGGSDEQKRSYLAMHADASDVAIGLALRSQRPDARRLAMTSILRTKGRALDSASGFLKTLRRNMSPDLRLLLDELTAIRTRLAAQWQAAGEESSATFGLDVVRRYEEREGEIESALRAKSAALSATQVPLRFEDVRGALPPDTALVEWFRFRPLNPEQKATGRWGAPHLAAAVVVAGQDPEWIDLGPLEPINTLVRAALGAFSSLAGKRKPRFDPRATARELEAKVFEPVRARLGPLRRALLAPDGDLNLVPFAALVDEQGHYLVESWTLSYLTSGRDLLRFRVSTPPRSPALVIGAPAFDKQVEEQRVTDPSSPPGQLDLAHTFKPLIGAKIEALAIAALLHVPALTDDHATERALRGAVGPRMLHLATHAFFREETGVTGLSTGPSPLPFDAHNAAASVDPLLQSGIALSGANIGGGTDPSDDGILTALELSSLDLEGTKLAALSACDTARGKRIDAEGVYGLRRALVLAGAEAELSTLWKVDDRAALELMEPYYQRLGELFGRSEALRDVQLRMLATADYAHPYYWAAFQLHGDPSPLDEDPAAKHTRVRGRTCVLSVLSIEDAHAQAWVVIAICCLVRCARRRRRP